MPRKKADEVIEPIAREVEEKVKPAVKGGYVAFEDFEQNWNYEATLPNGRAEVKRDTVSCKAGEAFVPPAGWLHDKAYEQATQLKSQQKRGCWFLLPLGSRAQLPVKEL